MKRKIISLLMASIIMALPISVQAAEGIVETNTSGEAFGTSITPFWTYTENQTLTVQYNKGSAVPSTYYYEYYNNNVKSWMRGTLKLKSTKTASSGKVTATFSGTLYSSPL